MGDFMHGERLWYAHSLEGRPSETWQPLHTHLIGVATRAEAFAAAFGAGAWGRLAGLWHDVGKYTDAFQRRLAGEPIRCDHSTAGAALARDLLEDQGKLLAYALAGHHTGLPDGKSDDPSCLAHRLQRAEVPSVPQWLGQAESPGDVPFTPAQGRMGFQCAFFIRMLYSCLVDADFLDTEAFLDHGRSALRGGYPDLAALWEGLRVTLDGFRAKVHATPVNVWRSWVLSWCLAAAEEAPGLFSLTVPTGGGKTLSSLAFALKHALAHGLDRIIYVIPYTSIIEQNAEVFRQALGAAGKEAVLEHHSNFDPRRIEEDPAGGETLARRLDLAAENWDAPLVVTTNVQFFESLFAHRSSRCRKLHNIAKSVVILDEAQMLPPPLLRPCLEALRELYQSYGATVVLCTATQPALARREDFPFGLDAPREIVRDVAGLFAALRRTRIVTLGKLSDADLAARLRGHEQVLCVVNTRRHARLLHELLGGGEGVFHLSANMCPAHRTEKLQAIRAALKEGRLCRVVSTQLVECGVDVDFPVVYRAEAGIDSVAQAGGRCNREGLLAEGIVYVFEAEAAPPPGELRRAAEEGGIVLRHFADALSPEAVTAYFEALYWRAGKEGLDAKGVLLDLEESASRGDFPLRQVSAKFQLIESAYEPVIIPWGQEGEAIVKGLRHAEHAGRLARQAQRYTVQIPGRIRDVLIQAGIVECVREGFYALGRMEKYDKAEGLRLDGGEGLLSELLLA